MKRLRLSNINKYLKVDEEDYHKIKDYKWRITSDYGKLIANVKKDDGMWGSRCISYFLYPRNKGKEIMHINGDILDYRKENIIVLHKVKSRKKELLGKVKKTIRIRKSLKESIFWGVRNTNEYCYYKGKRYKTTKKYLAVITYKRKQIYLGTFDNEIDAGRAYDKKARELYGGNPPHLNEPLIYNYEYLKKKNNLKDLKKEK